MREIINNYPVTDDEYAILEKEFDGLLHYAGWQLLKKNTQNNHTEEEEDIAQELRLSVIRAGAYYKRQVYIESCFRVLNKYVTDSFSLSIVENLMNLWKARTRHGANRQKFGPPQESMLQKLTERYVPAAERPSRKATLVMDTKFKTYCKSIAWNSLKSIGRKITKEKFLRSGIASLSSYDYLGAL